MAKKKKPRGKRKPVRPRPLSRGQRNARGTRTRALRVARPRKKPARSASKGGQRRRATSPPKRPARAARPARKPARVIKPRAAKARHPKPQQTRPVTRAASKPVEQLVAAHGPDLKYRLALIRKHVRGFKASDGYDARKLRDWSPKRIERVFALSGKLKELLASPHDIKTARTQKARKNLKQFTGQSIRGQKHFIVHKPSDRIRVSVRDGNIEFAGSFQGGVITRSRFFLFPRRPRYPKELVSMAKRMLKEMPEGFYTVLTAAHGDTGEPFDKGQLLARLAEYLAAYEVDEAGRPTGFSDAVLGFRYLSTTLRGAEVQRGAVNARRERQRELNKKKFKAAKKAAKKKVARKK